MAGFREEPAIFLPSSGDAGLRVTAFEVAPK
jgi:hypothetical protein